jgi:TPR repeat protein
MRGGLSTLATAAALLGAASALAASGAPGAERSDLVRQATAYEHGEGVGRDFERAHDLYCRAARGGDAEAQFALGWMYANGRGRARSDGGSPAHRKRIAELVRRLAPAYAVDPRLALAVISVESNFDPKAVSPKQAGGLMQLIPQTAQRFKVGDVFDPADNIRGGLAYLRWLLAYYQGRVDLAAAAYNAGEGAVDRHGGIPPYRETQTYVARVMKLFKRVEHPYDDTVTRPSPAVAR